MPNWVYLPDLIEPVPADDTFGPVLGTTDTPNITNINVSELSAANSFGMPSPAPAEWQADLIATKGLLKRGRILIASVVGTADPQKADAVRSLINDFVDCARLAAETEPHAVELNFSCPNVYGKEGSIFHDPEIAGKICKKVRTVLPDTKLLVKIGYLPITELKTLFDATFRYVDGYTAINTCQPR
jgi:dihydroorotate dehydrogenase (NAD+) catalytic subunit